MTYKFRPAVREQTSLLIGIAGPSSSGKTYSALRLATGMGGPVIMIDTEGRRGLHYADNFDFQHGDLVAPFRPGSYLQALQDAEKAGAKVIIVDSMSHEHEGPGGILEWHEEELQRMAGDDWAKRERVKFTAWIKPKAEHNKLVNAVLQLGVHVIFCFRAKEKLLLVRNDKGKTEPINAGWQAICSDRFEYEMTSLLVLPPNAQGVPDLSIASTKIQEQHKPIFKAGQQINEQMGEQLAAWAAGSAKKETQKSPPATSKSGGEETASAGNGSDIPDPDNDPDGYLAYLGDQVAKCQNVGAVNALARLEALQVERLNEEQLGQVKELFASRREMLTDG